MSLYDILAGEDGRLDLSSIFASISRNCDISRIPARTVSVNSETACLPYETAFDFVPPNATDASPPPALAATSIEPNIISDTNFHFALFNCVLVTFALSAAHIAALSLTNGKLLDADISTDALIGYKLEPLSAAIVCESA